MLRLIVLSMSHIGALVVGFALGVYLLPILTAPPSPDADSLQAMSAGAEYSAPLTRDLPGSDFLHWGEGTMHVSASDIVHVGRLAPGPDYKLYLVPDFVDDEASFAPLKDASVIVGDVKTFEGFILPVPDGIDIEAYTTVLVWCEAFGEFITSVKYR